MTVRKCQNCGAPLPTAKEGESIRCTYCGAENRPHATVVQKVVMVVRGPADAAAGRRVAGIVTVVVVLGIFATVGIFLWRVLAAANTTTTYGPPQRPPGTSVTITTIKAAPGSMLQFGTGPGGVPLGGGAYAPQGATVTEAEIGPGQKVKPEQLAALLTMVPVDVDPAGLSVSWPSFDPLAAFPWAMKTALAWNADAVLAGVRAEGLRDDGTGACASGGSGSTMFQFASPSQGRLKGLTLLFGDGRVRAREQAAPRIPAAGPELRGACSMKGVLDALRQAGLPAGGPFRVQLDPSSDGEWQWWTSVPGKGRLEAAAAAACP